MAIDTFICRRHAVDVHDGRNATASVRPVFGAVRAVARPLAARPDEGRRSAPARKTIASAYQL